LLLKKFSHMVRSSPEVIFFMIGFLLFILCSGKQQGPTPYLWGGEGFQRASDKPFGRARRHGTLHSGTAIKKRLPSRGRTDAIRGTTPVGMPKARPLSPLTQAYGRFFTGGFSEGCACVSCRRACTIPGSLWQAVRRAHSASSPFHIGQYYIVFGAVCQGRIPANAAGQTDEVIKRRGGTIARAASLYKEGMGMMELGIGNYFLHLEQSWSLFSTFLAVFSVVMRILE
jgi:hypothetical protein